MDSTRPSPAVPGPSVGVTAAAGFRAGSSAAGLKSTGALDVTVVVNDGPSRTAAAVFTANRFAAAPVLWTRQCVREGELAAVVLNSGGANACTGPQGFADTHRTAEALAEMLGVGAIEIGVCSTGLIGEPLDMDRLLPGVRAAVAGLSPAGGAAAAQAIMTTDSVPKTAVRTAGGVAVGGMAKGAGMLAPGMATMLSVLTTDALVDPGTADRVLREAVEATFNRVDSDGCMSTNDTVVLLASGASGVELPQERLAALVHDVCADLSRQLVGDAEGATKDIRIQVRGAASADDALAVGRAVARSNLFKCAVHGADPNWGRIVSAVGTTHARFEPDQVDVAINGVWICRGGAAGDDRAEVDMTGREVLVEIELAAGPHGCAVWTNDLTAAYVHENSAYST